MNSPRTVALKLLPAHRSGGAQKTLLMQEACAASALDHPNIGVIHGLAQPLSNYISQHGNNCPGIEDDDPRK